MIDVVNLQRKIKIEVKEFRTFSRLLTSAIPEASKCRFSVAFISDLRMKQLNEMFRGKNATTDVLSFPASLEDFEVQPPATASGTDTFLGDIVISAEQAKKQAAQNGLTLEGEIKQVILHGLLHLCGYDHDTDDGKMVDRELELREELGI